MKFKLIVTTLFIALILAPIPVVQAADTFYVATNGFDSNPGTLASPWKTIQKAMNSATAGSTVNIRGGTYNERLNLNVSGSANNYITFQPYGFTGGNCGGYTGIDCGGEKVIVDLAYLGTVSDGVPFLNIIDKSYIKIQGITFQNLTTYERNFLLNYGVSLKGNSGFIEFRHNKFLNNKDIAPWDGTSALAHFFVRGPSHDIVVYGNEFGNLVTNYGEGLSFTTGAYNLLVENNFVHDTSAIGIDFHGGAKNYVARGNRLEYISIKRDGSGVWYGNASIALYNDGGSSGVFENNFVNQAGVGIEILSEPGQPAASTFTVKNNIVQNSRHGIVVGTWYSNTDGSSVSDINVFNNTFYKNDIGIVIRPMVSSTFFWKNNIFANNTNNYVNTLNWNPGTADYNLFFGTAGTGSHIITSDPQFVNAAAGDYHLKSTSPAINAGTTVPVSTDKDGIARPVGTAYDIGAYEYGGVVSPTPTPTPVPTPKGDLNNDKIVNSLDWSLMNSKWFMSDATADLNGDGIVNSLDFSIMNGNWLKSG